MLYRYLSTECDPIRTAYQQGLVSFPRSHLRQFTEHRNYFLLQTESKSLNSELQANVHSVTWLFTGCMEQKQHTIYILLQVLKNKMHLLLYKIIRNVRSILHEQQETLDTFSNTEKEVLST